MKKEIIINLVETLIEDCEVQENALRQRLDVSWDCYDIGNWQNMAANLYEIKAFLKKAMK